MGDPCQICGAEPAARLTLLGASDPLTIVACVRHRNALAYEIGQAIGHLLSAETTLRAAPSARAETGAMQFGSDWRGFFIRGDDAFYFAQQLAMAGTWLVKQGADSAIAQFSVNTIERLRDLLLTAHQQRTDVEVQLLRPFDECSDRAAPYPIHHLGSDMRRTCYLVSKIADTLIMTRDVARVTCSDCLAIIKGGE